MAPVRRAISRHVGHRTGGLVCGPAESRVKLKGLASGGGALNGRHGVCTSWDAAGGRCAVELSDDSADPSRARVVAVRPGNLEAARLPNVARFVAEHATTESTEAVEAMVRGLLALMRDEGVDLDDRDAVATFGRTMVRNEEEHGTVNARGQNVMAPGVDELFRSFKINGTRAPVEVGTDK